MRLPEVQVRWHPHWRDGEQIAPTVDAVEVDGRPLVVIDPEDREQVERLVRNLPLDWGLEQPDDPDLFHESVDQVAAALREFANPTPPKPDEPTGLGAVVEDSEGQRWMRGSSMRGLKTWVNGISLDSKWRSYRDISAVKVLSDGVTS